MLEEECSEITEPRHQISPLPAARHETESAKANFEVTGFLKCIHPSKLNHRNPHTSQEIECAIVEFRVPGLI